MFESKSLFALCILFLIAAQNGVLASEVDTNEFFIEGKKLIESNCYDCYGGTKEGLEEGVSKLEALVKKELISAELFKLLGEAYFTFANAHYSNGSLEQATYRKKGSEAIKRAYELNPGDLGLAKRFIQTLPIEKQIEAYEKIYEERADADAAYSLGMISIYKKDDINKGIMYLKQSYKLAKGHTKITYGGRLLEIIRSRRSATEYEDFRAIYKKDKRRITGSN